MLVLTPSFHMKELLIIVAPALLQQFHKLTGGEQAMRELIAATCPDLREEWFESNHKLLIEGQRKGMWPAGFDCIDYPELKFVAQDGHTVDYPIDCVPVAPNWLFIYSPLDLASIPGKQDDGVLYVTEFPECLLVGGDRMLWKPWKLTYRMGVHDGMHRGKVEL